MKGEKRIMVFGHIPDWAGGRQSHGAANVIYNLAYKMSLIPGAEIFLVATDVYQKCIIRDNLTIIGWSKYLLLFFPFRHPFFTLYYILFLIKLFFSNKGMLGFWGLFFKGIYLRSKIDVYRPEIVHLHGPDAAIYEKIIPKEVKIAVTLHGIVSGDLMIKHQSAAGKLEHNICCSKRISKIYFVSHKLVNDFNNKFGQIIPQVEVILNAYDSGCYYYIEPKSHDGLALCTIASMSDRKGQERVVDGIIKSGINCSYHCIGNVDEEIEERIKRKINGCNVDVYIYGTKRPSEIREILSEVDYMILPSSSEGFGLVFLEAIACGVPVILPRDLPILEEKGMIMSGVNALLLENSTADAIAKVIPLLNNNYFDHKKVSNTVINYTWDDIAKLYFESLKKL